MLALVALVAGVQLDMPVAAALVLEGPITIIAGVDCVRVVVLEVVVVVVEGVDGVVAGRQVVELLLVHQRGRGAR